MVRSGLALLEADFRRFALAALASWQALELTSPHLFQAIASLQRPAWGSWNGLLSALKKARRELLRSGAAEVREKLQDPDGALTRLLARLDERAPAKLKQELAPLTELTRQANRRSPRGAVVVFPNGRSSSFR